MTHLKTIKLKALHHPEYHLTTRLKLHIHTEDFNAQRACLNKYFPKYYRNLTIEIPAKDRLSVTKLRQTKVIDRFTGGLDDSDVISKLEQRIFRNKRKSVKSLPLFFSPSDRKRFRYRTIPPGRPQFSTFFPRLTSLNLSLIEKLDQKRMRSLFVSRELEQKIKHSYGYFWNGLRCLEHLEISSRNYNFWFMIQEVNSSPHFLSSLKTFKLSLIFSPDPKFNSRVRDLLHQLAKNRHLLNQVTHLDCEKFLILHYYDDVMGSILAQCTKLVSVNILIGREAWYYADVKEIFKEHEGTQVFQQLGKMNKLHTLNVSAFGIKSFVQHFSVPLSVRKLILYVGKSLKDTSWLDLFQEPEYNFFERWKGLSNLQTLKLKIRMIKNPHDLLEKFVHPLFEAFKGSWLRKLRLEVTEPAYFLDTDKVEVIDFSQLPEKISALKQLESFKVLADNWKVTLDPTKSHFLSGLKKFAIDGLFPEKFDSQSFLQSLVSSTAGKDKYQKILKLSKFSFESIEIFDEFLKLAKKAARSGNLVLNVKLALFVDKDLEKLFNYFKQTINLGENCTVALKIWLMPPASSNAKNKKLSESNKTAFKTIFGSLKLRVIQRGTSSGYNKTLLEF